MKKYDVLVYTPNQTIWLTAKILWEEFTKSYEEWDIQACCAYVSFQLHNIFPSDEVGKHIHGLYTNELENGDYDALNKIISVIAHQNSEVKEILDTNSSFEFFLNSQKYLM